MGAEIKYPQFIQMDNELKKNYLDILKGSEGTFLNGLESTDIYFLAAALGYKNHLKSKTKKSADIRLFDSMDEKYKDFVKMIALAENNYDFDILNDGSYVLSLSEEYVNGGITLLFDMVMKGTKDNNDFSHLLLKELF